MPCPPSADISRRHSGQRTLLLASRSAAPAALAVPLHDGQVVMYGCTADLSKEEPHLSHVASTLGA